MENAHEFEAATAQLTHYIVEYFDKIRKKMPFPAVKPGFMKYFMGEDIPEKGVVFDEVISDVQTCIMPGLCHWLHPQFAAYFPAQTSYPAILAEMLSNAFANDVISWKLSPSATELEVIVVDWLAKAMKLPDLFLSTSDGDGGGAIQGSSTESMILSLFSARTMYLNTLKETNPKMEDGTAVMKLIAYKSAETHASFGKACNITMINVRNIQIDEKRAIRGSGLSKAIEVDRGRGLIPFFVCATLGSTSLLAFDNIQEIGDICAAEGIWLHIDSAFAGNAFICPEYRHLMKGVEFADSFGFSPHKWLQVPTSCAVLWLKNCKILSDACGETHPYLQCSNTSDVPDFTNMQLQCGRPFRSLKLWFVLRLFGMKRLRELIRQDIRLAQYFKELLLTDNRFELIGDNIMSLVCFRLKGSNEINKVLLELINGSREMHLVCSNRDDVLFLRFVFNTFAAEYNDIHECFKVLSKMADKIIRTAPPAAYNLTSNISAVSKHSQKIVSYCCCLYKTID